MPTKVEKDAATGQETTGHEWDGIKELNTPLPKWWLYVLYATIAWAVVWWFLYPSWPWFGGYFQGLLGYNQREALMQRIYEAEAARADWMGRLETTPLQEIMADPELQALAFAGGQAAFADNCAPCHGLGGAGQGPYPSLADDAWIWGGSLEAIHHTISHGVRNEDADARFNLMPAFGADGILDRQQIQNVTTYVLSLSGQAPEDVDVMNLARGAALFTEQCAACHGDDGTGNYDLGAPDLTDQIWLYGSEPGAIRAQIWNPRHGVMPSWVERNLDPATLASLAVYVHGLGGGE